VRKRGGKGAGQDAVLRGLPGGDWLKRGGVKGRTQDEREGRRGGRSLTSKVFSSLLTQTR